MPFLQIIDQEENDDTTKVEETTQPLCYICQEKPSNYICPRCNLRYCSLSCYKHQKHSTCTETFYKENVMAEMQSLEADDVNKKSIQTILQKFEAENDQQQPSSLYDNTNDNTMKTMEQRFEDMDITKTDASTIWELLSPQEQHEFQALMKMDAWQGLDLPEYEPWWTIQASKVTDLDNDENDTDIPALPTSIPELSTIMKSPPAPHLIFHLLHVLMTYTYLARQTMGDLADDLDYGVKSLSCLSKSVLFSTPNDTVRFTKVNDVCTDIKRHIDQLEQDPTTIHSTSSSTTSSIALDIILLKDTEQLFKNGKDYTLRALGELYQLLDFSSKEKRSTDVKTTRKKLSLAARKAYFFMVYANNIGQQQQQQQQQQQLDLLVMTLRNEYQRLEMDQGVFEAQRKVARDAMVEQRQKRQGNDLVSGNSGSSKIIEIE